MLRLAGMSLLESFRIQGVWDENTQFENVLCFLGEKLRSENFNFLTDSRIELLFLLTECSVSSTIYTDGSNHSVVRGGDLHFGAPNGATPPPRTKTAASHLNAGGRLHLVRPSAVRSKPPGLVPTSF